DESLSENTTNTDPNSDYSNENSDTDYSNIVNSNKTSNVKFPDGRECGQLVKTQGSTSNFQTHLNIHGITKPTKVINTTTQSTITETFHRAAGQNLHQKEFIDRALVKWIVTNMQPLYVLQNTSFIEFVHVLNPYYELPSDKFIKALIHQSYNYSAERLKNLFATEIKTCGLTCDLWTARSKS
ncbi:19340_t:CDS:2, partial [Gigaspora rosea]